MTTNGISDAADDLADDVASTGRAAAGQAKRVGDTVGDAIEDAADHSARRMRGAGRRGRSAYDDAMDGVEGEVESLSDTIRRNPLASAGAALLVGVVLGRFFL